MANNALLVAKQSFWCEYEGKRTLVKKGSVARAGHPIVKGRESLFRSAEVTPDYDVVEQATAAPGERRQLPDPEEKKRGPGRPKLPRDAEGNIIRE